jgi:hypothetical protein
MTCEQLEEGADLAEERWEKSRRFAIGARLVHLMLYVREFRGEPAALYWYEGGAEQVDRWAALAVERDVALWDAPWAL